MGRSRQPSGYPTIFSRIVQSVSTTGRDFIHDCTSQREAQTLRFTFYDYFKALRNSNLQFDQDLSTQAQGLMLCIRGNQLIIKARDTMEQALALADTLEQAERKDEKEALRNRADRIPVSPFTINPASITTDRSANTLNESNQPKSHDEVISQYLKGDKK